MSWSDRRTLLLALPLALPLLAAGCGFTPVYGPDGIGTKLRGQILADNPNSEEDYYLVRRLEEQLGHTVDPVYLLHYTITTDETDLAVNTEGDITRYNVLGRVRYQMVRQSDDTVMVQGDVENFTAYSASGSPVDTLSAERDATRRLMVILADQIVAVLYTSVDLSTPPSPAGPT